MGAAARAAGLGPASRVPAVGDGASWIIGQCAEQFGRQGRYLVDFDHVSEHLAAAAVIQPRDPVGWRRRQQGRLLTNPVGAVLRALAARRESEAAVESPVRTAHRYLTKRREHLDYAGARARVYRLVLGKSGVGIGPWCNSGCSWPVRGGKNLNPAVGC